MEQAIGEKKVSNESSNERYGALVHNEAIYKQGYEDKIAEFGVFKDLPINTGFSWGSKSKSMSYKWNEFEGESADELAQRDREEIKSRIVGFLRPLGIEYPGKGIIHMLGVFEGSQDQFQAVDFSTIDQDLDETVVKANFVYTLDPEVVVAIRPADCPISVIYAKNKAGQDIVGFVHLSGLSVNAGIPREAIRHLIEVEDVDISSIRIGITPGISYNNFSMAEVEEVRDDVTLDADGVKSIQKSPIIENNWKRKEIGILEQGGHISPRRSGELTEIRNVDIMGATIMQYIESGIDSSQIEAFDMDTYEAMKAGEGFSDILWGESRKSGKPIAPGRYMVALQLKPKILDEKQKEFPKAA